MENIKINPKIGLCANPIRMIAGSNFNEEQLINTLEINKYVDLLCEIE